MAEKHSGGSRGRQSGQQHRTSGRGQNEDEPRRYSLEEREYRSADGQIHHHTNAYMAKHGGEGRGGRGRNRGSGQHGRGDESDRGGQGGSDRR